MFELVPWRRGPREFLERFFAEDEPFFSPFLPSIKADIRDEGDRYVLEAEVPGVNKEQIHLTYDNNQLNLKVNHTEEIKEEGKNYLRRERRMGQMSRSFYLEGVDRENIRAKYENGILTVYLPKTRPAQEDKRIIIE